MQSNLHQNPHDSKSQQGFTQAELLLVILLAGILPTSITAVIALNANPSLPKLSHSFTQSSG
jgi:Tfp pilus assembly protein FimT